MRPFSIAACLAGLLLTAACAGGQSNVNPLSPTAPASTGLAPLTVQVDRICEGQESQIRVFVDAAPMGVTNPGEAGVSRMVTVGEHKLTAISQRGTQWGPYSTVVSSAGQLERLGCLPPPEPPEGI